MMIPKIIHYCWFGKSDKPNDIKRWINGWKFILDDYEFVEWNESNTDLNTNAYIREAYVSKKYAFVSDFIRLKALYAYGGIYLDADVEVRKKFDVFLNHEMFLVFMFDCNIGTAVIGAKKHHRVVGKLMDLYENKIVEKSPNNDLFTKFFLHNFSSFKLNGKYQCIKDVVIYPKEFFERPTWKKSTDYSIHHYKGSWYGKQVGIFKRVTKLLLGDILYSQLSHYKAMKMSPFYSIYLEDSNK